MSVIDILFLAIIVVFAIFSYKRGFMRTILEVVAFVLAIILASFLAKPVGSMFYNSFIKSNVENHIENAINEINFDNHTVTKDQGAQIVFENIPEFAKKIANGTGLTDNNILAKIKKDNFTSIDATEAIVEKIVEPIVLPATQAVSFIILAAVLIFLLRLFAAMISKANEDDGFSTDKLLGGIFGIAKGLVVVYVVCAMLQLIFYSNASSSSGFGEMLSKSQVFNFMINNNPVIEGLKNMF
ncbi:MAG: CvpA family protein [Ruminococcaceae bacterium]|jgi:uncharacterized membrane protein required for colicin V production|nr:CvpA family protein [Oscillospiraceae bacterium]